MSINFLMGIFLSLSWLGSSYSIADSDIVKAAPDSQYQNWDFISEKDGIKTFQRDTDEGRVGFRGEVTLDVPIEQVAAILADMPLRKKWMDEVVETRRIRMTSIFDRVEYNHTAVPWPFHDRDFVYSAKVTVDPKESSMTISMHSVEDAEQPPISGIVRGQMHSSRYYLKEVEKGKRTFVTVEIVVDPMGAIPKWIVRMKQKKWPRNTLGGMRDYLSKNQVPVPEEFKVFNK